LVLANGRDVLPLEPAELVRDWKGNVRDMMKKVKRKNYFSLSLFDRVPKI